MSSYKSSDAQDSMKNDQKDKGKQYLAPFDRDFKQSGKEPQFSAGKPTYWDSSNPRPIKCVKCGKYHYT